MPTHDTTEISGRITDVFHHRFVIETSTGRRVLADLGPKGIDVFRLVSGDEVVARGEMKPSELKVVRIAKTGQVAIEIPHKPKHDHHDREPDAALAVVRDRGLQPIGLPQRKPKHFEVLARSGSTFMEVHVELDGHIRKEKVVGPHDDKWADAIHAASLI